MNAPPFKLFNEHVFNCDRCATEIASNPLPDLAMLCDDGRTLANILVGADSDFSAMLDHVANCAQCRAVVLSLGDDALPDPQHADKLCEAGRGLVQRNVRA